MIESYLERMLDNTLEKELESVLQEKGLLRRIKEAYSKLSRPVRRIIEAVGIGGLTYVTLMAAYLVDPETIGNGVKELVRTYLKYRGIDLTVEEALKYAGGVRGILARLSAIPAGAYLVFASMYDE